MKLHDGEVDIDTALVRSLLAAQFPQWAALPLRPVPTTGTEHMLYRLGRSRSGWPPGTTTR